MVVSLIRSLILFSLSFLLAQDNPAYIRYFLSEKDYKQNRIQEKPAEGIPYLKVIYNDKNDPVSLLRIDSGGKIWEKNIFSYTAEGELESKLILDSKDAPRIHMVYSEDEPWSAAYRDYSFPGNLNQSFYGQTTTFRFSEDGTLNTIEFTNVNDQPYGQITFTYDYLGFVREEIWRSLPSARLIRRFIYDIDLQKQAKKLWEYGRDGREISYVELEMAPEDKLYPNPFPRTGNTLDEVDIVLNEIIRTGIMPPFPAKIPHMESDQIYLRNGDIMDIEIIQVTATDITFKLKQDESQYVMPLFRVREIKNRWGEILYPKIK